MRKLKKVLATALAGVLALTVLAGCSSGGFNKSEFIKQVGDYDGVTYKDIGESQAATVEDALRKTSELLGEIPEEEVKDYEKLPQFQLRMLTHYTQEPSNPDAAGYKFAKKFWDIKQELFKKLEVDPEDSDLCCYLSLTAMEDFGSAHYQKSLENALAANVMQNRSFYCMTSNCDTGGISYLSNQGTVSLKTITLDGKQYLLGVWKVIA